MKTELIFLKRQLELINFPKFSTKLFIEFDLYKKPFFPSLSISIGPFGQSLENIILFIYPASNITNPGSSHRDDKTKIFEFFK